VRHAVVVVPEAENFLHVKGYVRPMFQYADFERRVRRQNHVEFRDGVAALGRHVEPVAFPQVAQAQLFTPLRVPDGVGAEVRNMEGVDFAVVVLFVAPGALLFDIENTAALAVPGREKHDAQPDRGDGREFPLNQHIGREHLAAPVDIVGGLPQRRVKHRRKPHLPIGEGDIRRAL
jgi:hypothetical protein